MVKRTAQEAFPKAPVSAFAAARARKAALIAEPASTTVKSNDLLREPIPLEDSTPIESVTEDADELDVAPDSPEAAAALPKERLTNVKLPAKVAVNSTLELTLKADQYITCNGTYCLTVLAGAVTVHGAYLTAESPEHSIYAPSTHALPTIVARFDSTKIRLRPLDSGIQALQQLSPLWNRVWPRNAAYSVVLESGDSADALNATGLSIEPAAQDVLNRLNSSKTTGPAPKILVTGGKGAGKSTFCRTLLNSILTTPGRPADATCFWLDLDPGQPEFSSGGQVSLVQVRQPVFGPAYTHAITHPALSHRTVLAHSLAANSPREDMAHYLACAKSLMQRYISTRRTHNNAPIVINCPGWIAGSGADLIQNLIKDLEPPEVIVLDSADAATAELSETLQQSQSKKMLVTILPARRQTLKSRPASELRAMQAMAYHHARVDPPGSLSWSSTPIPSTPSWTVPYSGPDQAIDGIISYYDPIPLEHLASILPFSPISLLSIRSNEAFPAPDNVPPYTLVRSAEDLPLLLPSDGSGIFPPLLPAYSSCLGQAIITHVDVERKELHLATPVTQAEIAAAGGRVVLVRGKQPVAEWALLERVYAPPAVAAEDFDLSESEDEGAAETPYVAVRNVTGDDDAARAVGESVWRPRFLPRKI